jgi:hypothetical protein
MTFTLPTALRDGDQARSRRALCRYFHGDEHSRPFAGRHFDNWGTHEASRFTSDDIVALGFLSVNVPADVVPDLVLDPAGRLATCLTDPGGSDRDLRDVAPEEIDPDWAPWRLWRELRDMTGLGPTKTSKLIARKRPHLIPIWDTVVGQVVGPSNGYWVWLCTELRASDGALHEQLLALRDAVKVGPDISALRVFDVIAWMEGKGYDT